MTSAPVKNHRRLGVPGLPRPPQPGNRFVSFARTHARSIRSKGERCVGKWFPGQVLSFVLSQKISILGVSPPTPEFSIGLRSCFQLHSKFLPGILGKKLFKNKFFRLHVVNSIFFIPANIRSYSLRTQDSQELQPTDSRFSGVTAHGRKILRSHGLLAQDSQELQPTDARFSRVTAHSSKILRSHCPRTQGSV